MNNDNIPTGTEAREGQPTDTEAREALKFGFDSVKQLTTLSSGSIVLIGAFSKSILPTSESGQLSLNPPGLKYLLVLSFISLGASTLLGAYATFLHIRLMRDLGKYLGEHGPNEVYEFEPQRTAVWRMTWSFYLFVFGLLCFGTLVLVSLL